MNGLVLAVYTANYAETDIATAFNDITDYLDGNYFSGEIPPIPGDDFVGNAPVTAIIDLETMTVINRDYYGGHGDYTQQITIDDVLLAVEQADAD
jgi:hypothetical protein